MGTVENSIKAVTEAAHTMETIRGTEVRHLDPSWPEMRNEAREALLKELPYLLVRMVELEWGSEEQIEAENTCYLGVSALRGIDWENFMVYLHKATTAEAQWVLSMAYHGMDISKYSDD